MMDIGYYVDAGAYESPTDSARPIIDEARRRGHKVDVFHSIDIDGHSEGRRAEGVRSMDELQRYAVLFLRKDPPVDRRVMTGPPVSRW